MVQIYRNKTIVGSQEVLDRLKEEFRQKHSVVLKDLLAPSLKAFVTTQLNQANYLKKVHEGKNNYIIGEEFMVDSKNILYNMFFLLMNTNEYLEAIRYITDCHEIQSFSGRIYRLDSSDDCFDSWHDDVKPNEGRLIGISLNLSNEAYNGGHFIIRNKSSKEVYNEISYKDWGTAHLFRIEEKLQHKVTKVTGVEPRVAYAGWFRSEMGFKDYLKS